MRTRRPHATAIACSLACLLLAGGCATPRVNEQTLVQLYASHRGKPKAHPVIFIPGTMGSVLQDRKTGKTVWGKVGSSLADLMALPIDAVNLLANRDSLAPSGLLGKLTWIPGVVEKDVYNNVIRIAIQAGGFTMGKDAFALSYDWRRDLVESSRQLGELIDKIKLESGNKDLKVDILCHSTGGLIARYYAKYGTEDVLDKDPMPAPTYAGAANINKVIMLGVPQTGSLESFQRLNEGLWLPTVMHLTPEMIFTMPSIYELLPYGEEALFIDGEGNPEAVDIYDATSWHTYGWSVFSPAYQKRIETRFISQHGRVQGERMYKENLEQQIVFLAAALQRAKQFHRALWNGDPQEERSKVTYVVLGSDCQPTLERALLRQTRTGWETKFTTKHRFQYQKMYTFGDRSVTKQSLLGTHLSREGDGPGVRRELPVAYSGFVCESHADLTKSPTYMDNVLHILLED